jgi:hypothetical protein
MIQGILIAVYYIVGSVCLLILLCEVDLCEIHYDSFLQLLESTEFDVKGSGYATESLLFQLVSVFLVSATFTMLLCILLIIVSIISFGKEDRQNLSLMCLWLFTHTCYTLLAFVGLLSSIPVCVFNLDQILESFSSSVLNALITCIFLRQVNIYRRKMMVRPNRTTQELSQNPNIPVVTSVVVGEENDDHPPSYAELFSYTLEQN